MRKLHELDRFITLHYLILISWISTTKQLGGNTAEVCHGMKIIAPCCSISSVSLCYWYRAWKSCTCKTWSDVGGCFVSTHVHGEFHLAFATLHCIALFTYVGLLRIDEKIKSRLYSDRICIRDPNQNGFVTLLVHVIAHVWRKFFRQFLLNHLFQKFGADKCCYQLCCLPWFKFHIIIQEGNTGQCSFPYLNVGNINF